MTIALASLVEQTLHNRAIILQLIKEVMLVNDSDIEPNCTLCPPSSCAL